MFKLFKYHSKVFDFYPYVTSFLNLDIWWNLISDTTTYYCKTFNTSNGLEIYKFINEAMLMKTNTVS